MSSDLDKDKKVTFIKDLFERRFPQIILIYLGVCWTVLEFLGWIIDRYMISPLLIDFSFITLMSLIPTVGMLAYFHGRPGRDNWTKTEKVGIPINLIFSAALLVIIFSGKELGSTTTSIVVEDEMGQKSEREIPKGKFRKRLAIFFFENKSGDSDFDWLQYAIMTGCHLDLDQDPFFSVYSAYDNLIYQRILKAGFGNNVGMPMSLEKKIAKDIQREYFLGGFFSTENDTFVINTYLYDTIRGKLISEHVFKGKNIFSLMDEISLELKHDLKVPFWHIKEVEDLPVSELLTNSMLAYKEFIKGSNLVYLYNDYENSIDCFEKAVKEDPTFAMSYWGLYYSYINTNQPQKSLKAIQSTIQYIYKLPENLQFGVKEEYYLVTEKPEKHFAILKMWVKLYPRDIRGHFRLATEYLKNNQLDKAISEYHCIYKIDPERHYYLRYIGNIYLIKGEFKEALKYFKQHKKLYPNDYKSFSALGELYFTMGDYSRAKDYYLDAQVIEPTDVSIFLRLGDVDIELGNFDRALDQYNEALLIAKTPQERSFVYDALESFYKKRGQIRKSIENMNKKFTEQTKFLNPINLLIEQISEMSLSKYVMIGDTSEAFNKLRIFESKLSPPWSKTSALGYLDLYIELEDVENTKKSIESVEELIRIFGEESKRNIVYHAEGRINEWKGDYIEAILSYYSELEYKPTDVKILIDIGRCYRKVGNYSKAKKLLQTVLKIFPFSPKAHYEIAQVYIDTGDKGKSQYHLNITLNIWKGADPEYGPAEEALEKLRELESIS